MHVIPCIQIYQSLFFSNIFYRFLCIYSGLAVKNFIDTGAGVVDYDYRGPVGTLEILLYVHILIYIYMYIHEYIYIYIHKYIYICELLIMTTEDL
jgi:dUTPase